MKIHLLVSFAAAAALSSVGARAQSSSTTFYGVSKELHYTQNSTTAPVLTTTDAGLFEFALPDNIAGTLRTPGGTSFNVAANAGFQRRYPTRAAMDTAFPDGTYTVTVGNSAPISLALQSNYPTDIPRVLNDTWTQGRLVIDPTKDTVVQFNTFTGWGTVGALSHAYFSLWEGNGDDIINIERFSNEPGGPISNVTIPAGKLVAGHTYNVEVGWFAASSLNQTAIPNAIGFVGCSYTLEFQVSVSAAPVAPTFTAQPASQTIAAGSTVVFSATATGSPAPTYQWRRGTTVITGATSPTLVLSGAAAVAGPYMCVATNSAGTATSAAAALTVNTVAPGDAGRLVNLAIRTGAGTGAQTLIVGLGTGGAGTSGNKDLLVRAMGPSLAAFNLTGTLADPVATVFQGSTSVASNDNWAGDAQVLARGSQVGAFGFTGASSLDSALALSPAAGSYTVQVTGKNNGTGLVLAEIYDATPSAAFTATTPRLVNVSARTQVGTGGDILIAGFVIGGTTAKTVLIRAVGPTLQTFNVTGALGDPRLQLYSGATVIRENDNWNGDAQLTAIGNSVGAFPLGNPQSKDSILLVTLPPGSYTAQVSGVGNTTGVALVEVYDVP